MTSWKWMGLSLLVLAAVGCGKKQEDTRAESRGTLAGQVVLAEIAGLDDLSRGVLPLGTYRVAYEYPAEPERETYAVGGVAVTPGPALELEPVSLRSRFVKIADGASYVNTAHVTLQLGASDCSQMQVGNLPDLSDGLWQSCAPTLAWDLLPQDHSVTFGGGLLQPSTTYCFQIIATDVSGNSAASAATGEFRLTPNVPIYVVAIPGNGRVWVRWAASDPTDLPGYHVFRATSENGPYTELTTALCDAASTDPRCNAEAWFWEDTTITNGTNYWYYVASEDQLGNASEPSEKVSARPGPATGPTEVHGVYTGVVGWSERGSPYMVTETVSIEDSLEHPATLVIGPNTEVRFAPGQRVILHHGRIVALGRATVRGSRSAAKSRAMGSATHPDSSSTAATAT